MAGKYQHHPRQLDLITPETNSFGILYTELPKFQEEFRSKNNLLERVFGAPVTPKEFYRELFPEDLIEDESQMDQRRPNGIATSIRSEKQRNRSFNRIIFNDLETVEKYKDERFVIVAPVGYSGRTRFAKNAYCLFGIAIDLDHVSIKNLQNLMVQLQNDIIPWPTYIVNSGRGLHLYYFFDNQIPLKGGRDIEQFNRLKKGLIRYIWNGYTSSKPNEREYQGVLQGYRMIGTQTKLGEDYRVTAYRSGEKTTIRELNRFVDDKYKTDFDDVLHVSLAEAKELWPEWYERRIEKKQPVGIYELSDAQRKRRRAWYEAWKQKIKKGAVVGNRHNCCAVLYSYAYKAGIDIEEATEDARSFMDFFNSLGTEEFTDKDILDARGYYEPRFIKLGREGIMDKTGIDIGVTKRKAKPDTRQVSLQKARAIQNIDDPEGHWRNKNGRPSKRNEVIEYAMQHPGATPTQIAKAVGCSRPTVYKYLEQKDEQKIPVDYVVGEAEIEIKKDPDEQRKERMQRYRDNFVLRFQEFMEEVEKEQG